MNQVADELTTVVEEAFAKFNTMDETTISSRPSPDRWTIREVVGHLIDSASNNHQRFVRAQQVDELASPDYQQQQWVALQHYDETPWTELIQLWRLFNHHLAHVIRNVKPESLPVICHIGSYDPVTLQFLIEDYVVHMRHHLAKIDERLAAKT